MFPVLYLNDGQNLFEPGRAFGGLTWRVAETIDAAIAALRRLVERGEASGSFRPGLDPVDLHATITALTFFNVSNRHTFGQIFQRDFSHPDVAAQRRANIVETILRCVHP